jgi:DegV family protein with EDD domain
MKIKVSSDTSCLVTKDVLSKNNISVFPLNVIIDGNEFLDGVTINQEQLKEQMLADKVVKTSTPPLGQVINYFEELFEEGYDRIIHFTISSKLSSMFDLFSNVSKNYFDDKIIVVDSFSVSSLMLSHVLYTVDELQKGTNIETILAEIEKRKNDYYLTFVPKNLTTLKNGGRISPTIAAIGNTIGLKPVISLKEGELVKDTMTRNMQKAIHERIDFVQEKYPANKYDYTIVEFDANESIVEKLITYIESLNEDNKVVRGLIPINVCAHCGPGTIGFIATPKINGKSLKDFL